MTEDERMQRESSPIATIRKVCMIGKNPAANDDGKEKL
jgi:hypothetical protein